MRNKKQRNTRVCTVRTRAEPFCQLKLLDELRERGGTETVSCTQARRSFMHIKLVYTQPELAKPKFTTIRIRKNKRNKKLLKLVPRASSMQSNFVTFYCTRVDAISRNFVLACKQEALCTYGEICVLKHAYGFSFPSLAVLR